MQQIDDLRLEIESFEAEISSLQKELALVGGKTLELATSENSANAISKSIRSEAQRVIEQQPVLQGIRNAIAELNSRLQPKKLQLGELEAQELRQCRIERIEQGRSKLRAKFGDVEEAAESLKNLFFELKAIALEYEKDFAEINPPGSGNIVLNTASLLNYEAIALPKLVERDGRFILGSEFIDLFKIEKESLRQERLQQSLAWRHNHDEQVAQAQREKAEARSQTEQRERSALLKAKQIELVEIKVARANRLSSLKTADVGGFDSAIAKLEAEIENLQKAMQL